MGLVEVRAGVQGDPAFPATMMVASYGPQVAPADAGSLTAETSAPMLKAAAAEPHPKLGARTLPRGANFATQEEAAAAPLPVRHGPKRS
jgi:hypothetical protein